MEDNQQQMDQIIQEIQLFISSALNLGVPVTTISHIVNDQITNLEEFYLDDNSYQIAQVNHRAWGG